VYAAYMSLAALIISFVVTFITTPLCIYTAKKFNFFDAPDGVVKLQKKKVPYMGGIAVFFGFLVALIATSSLHLLSPLIIVGMLVLFLMGLFDDLFVIYPWQKFLGQFVACCCFVAAGMYLKEGFFHAWWSIPLSILWMATIINAFNLVDVMDGLASCIALGSLCPFMVIAMYFRQWDVATLLLSLCGALLAFLYFNRPPAHIYLGDTGSLFIGACCAIVPFFLPWTNYNWQGWFMPPVILAIPLLEVTALILIRTYKRIPFYLPSTDHFKCYLQDKQWSVKKILLFVLFLSSITGFVSLGFIFHLISLYQVILLGAMYFICWTTVIYR
jgi:UDP-GlcNAc:undecaprenyl-phosphate/decaprenyl-phosphate GlcNAc-1-phosphate transferase